MKLNKNIKNSLSKVLSKNTYTSLQNIWRSYIKPSIEIKKTIRLKSFSNKEIIRAKHESSGVEFLIELNKKNGLVDEFYFLDKIHEPKILSLINSILIKGDTYIDIGTNIGGHMLFASVCVGDTGTVYAFEPIKNIYEQADRSIKLNNFTNIKLFNCGLGEIDQKISIHIDPLNKGHSSVAFKEGDSSESEIVTIKNADPFFSEIKNKIKLIKIDVEGYEYDVLKGLSGLLKRNKPENFLIEYSPYFYNFFDNKISLSILSLLNENGYKIYDIGDGDKKKLITKNDFISFISEFQDQENGQTNILCTTRLHL